jgi:hypothetical protein
MSKAVSAVKLSDITFVCDDPACELATGGYGLTSAEIAARVAGSAPSIDHAPETDDTDDLDDDDDQDDDDDASDAIAEIDPARTGAPCPLCAAAEPPRAGKLLAVPTSGALAQTLAAASGLRGFAAWQLIQAAAQGSAQGTLRLLAAIDGAPPAAGAKRKGFVIGGAVLTAVVLADLPFDGHLVCFGNSDPWVRAAGKRKFTAGTPAYGPDQAAPSAAARANPVYVRELQEDLLWLGYFTPSRGSPPAGQFTYHVLGSVLAFKQDLAEIYGIPTTTARESVAPGSVEAGKFARPIHYQTRWVPPVAILAKWSVACAGKDGNSGLAVDLSVLERELKQLGEARGEKAVDRGVADVEKRLAVVEGSVAAWPHLAVLENITEPFMPFEPRAPTVSVDDLAIPEGATPQFATARALMADRVWKDSKFAARSVNRAAVEKTVIRLVRAVEGARGHGDEILSRAARIVARPGHEAAWLGISTRIATAVARSTKLMELCRFWTLDSAKQVTAWLAHLVEISTVDQPTAIYLKALREGGKIGPHARPAYQLLADPSDVRNSEEGASRVRKACVDRPRNAEGKRATTMPEVLGLQFLFNEGKGVFSHRVSPFNTRPGDTRRLALLGIDVRLPGPGVFDPTYHPGGDWFRCRGWGAGQTTFGKAVVDGVELIRGLPIMPPGATAVRHPRLFTGFDASLASALDDRAIPKFNKSARRDCSYGKLDDGKYYDCQTCLKRFFDFGLVGTGDHGAGGVFVPLSRKRFGSLPGATSVFVDLERYTAFARAGGAPEDPSKLADAEQYFGRAIDPAPPQVANALRRGPDIKSAAKAAAKELGLDAAAVERDLRTHIAARTDLPCSWFRVRIGYAGSGPRAIASLNRMLRVVGGGEGDAVMQKHIKEASELRRNA